MPFEHFVAEFVKPDEEYIETRTHHDPLATFRSDNRAPLQNRIPEGDDLPDGVYEVTYLERPFTSAGARQGSAIAFRDGKQNKVTWFCFARQVQRDIETMKFDENSGEAFLSGPAQDVFTTFEDKKRRWLRSRPFDFRNEPLVALKDSDKEKIDEVEGGKWLFEQVATLSKGTKRGIRNWCFEHRLWFESLCQAQKEVQRAPPKLKILLKGHNWDGKKDGEDEQSLVQLSKDDDDVDWPILVKKPRAYDLSAEGAYRLDRGAESCEMPDSDKRL